MKKISLMLAAMAILSAGAFAQDGTKKAIKNPQEPVKVSTTSTAARGEKVKDPAPVSTPVAPAPAKRAPKKKIIVKNQAVKKQEMRKAEAEQK